MGSFKLGKMTLRSLFGKPETVLYPVQEPEHPACMKGVILFNQDDCIYCGICQKRCPTGAISVEKQDTTWSIDHFSCIQCGSCVRECPKGCLSMDPVLVHPSTEKHVEVHVKSAPTKEELEAQERKDAEKAAKIKAAKEARQAKAELAQDE